MKCLSAIGTCHLDFELLCKRWEINTHTHTHTHTHTSLDADEKNTSWWRRVCAYAVANTDGRNGQTGALVRLGSSVICAQGHWKARWPEPRGTHAELGLKYLRHCHSLKDIKNTSVGRRGWDELKAGHGNICMTISKTDSQRDLLCAPGSSTQCSVTTKRGGMGWEMGGRFRREATYVNLWLIHVDVWQKPAQYCKAIILQ